MLNLIVWNLGAEALSIFFNKFNQLFLSMEKQSFLRLDMPNFTYQFFPFLGLYNSYQKGKCLFHIKNIVKKRLDAD